MNKILFRFASVILSFFLAMAVYFNADAAGNVYYVSTSGNDSNAGTLTAPFKTITKCMNKAAYGDTCKVLAGTYPEVVTVPKTKSGITFVAEGKAIAKAFLIYGSNNVLRGFTLTDKQSKAGIRLYGDNNLAENNEIYDTLEDGIWFWGKNNIIRGNYMHDLFDDRNWPEVDNHVDCMMSWDWSGDWSPATNTLIENNICDHNRSQGSNQSVIITGKLTTNTTFRGNRFIMHDAGYSPLALYGGTGYTIENNYFCNTTGKGSPAVWLEGAASVQVLNNAYAGYSSMVSGGASTSGNTQSVLPCQVNPTTVVPTPTATAVPFTPTPTATNSSTPTATAVPFTPTPTATNSSTPTATAVPFTPTPTATNSSTPTATAVPFTPTPTATNSPTPTATTVPFTSTPTATNTPVPTATSQPTSTPESPIVIPDGGNSVDIRVAKGSDDVEENSYGRMYVNSRDLELIYDNSAQVVGVRFTGVNIPKGAIITNAYIQFKAAQTSRKTITLTVSGEASPNASAFTNAARNVSKRVRTSNSVAWTPQPWSKAGEMGISQRTPNLNSIVQEIINQPNWNSGNSIVMIMSGKNGKRTAKSFDGDAAGAPLLHVEFSMPIKEAVALLLPSTSTPTPTATLLEPFASPTVTVGYTPEPTQALLSPTAPATEVVTPTETPSPTLIPPSPTVEVIPSTESPTLIAPVETALKAASESIKATEVVNTPPVITSNNNLSLAENTVAVTTVTAIDTDLPAQTLTYSISGGMDSTLFSITPSTGELVFISAPDFELPTDAGSDNIYNVAVQVSDGTSAATQDVVVTVIEVNDNSPTITSNGNLSTVENTAAVTTVTAIDADLPAQTLGYSISGGPDSTLFSINSSTGELSFIATPDFEIPADSGLDNIYNVTVQASDGALAITLDVVVTVTAVNDNNPVVTSSGSPSVAENATIVTTVTAADADLPAQALTYSIVGGVDSALFSINSSTGELTFVTPPDFEAPVDSGTDNVYNLTVQASDGVTIVTQDMVIPITEVNENAPVITSSGNHSIAENTTVITTVTATDADLPSQSLNYSISGGADSALFGINSSSGELTFIVAPDFEIPTDSGVDNVYNVTVQASDGTLATTQDVAVTVTPVNDNAPIVASSSNLLAAENTSAVTTVAATDADLPAQSLTYSIAGGVDSILFNINSSTGELTFVTAPDFESPADSGADNIYNLTVQASDGVSVTTQEVVITITAVNENTPVITSNGNLSITENATTVTTVTATDSDLPSQSLTYSISGGSDSALFNINSSTGDLSFVAAPDFDTPADFGLDNTYNIVVQASDGMFTSTQDIAITVNKTD